MKHVSELIVVDAERNDNTTIVPALGAVMVLKHNKNLGKKAALGDCLN